MAMPAARVGDSQLCPNTSPMPHIGGLILPPISPPGVDIVLIGGEPAATELSLCGCGGPIPIPMLTGINCILNGSPTVSINKLPAARLFDGTLHKGRITSGEPTVLIGDYAGAAAFIIFPGQQSFDNCGVQSANQIIHQATGKEQSERELLDFAVKEKCVVDPSGAAFLGGIVKLLKESGGVDATEYLATATKAPVSMDDIGDELADALQKNKGIIACVNSGDLWNDPKHDDIGGNHAIVITEGDFDRQGELTHVYINDTGTGQQGRRLTIEEIQRAMFLTDSTGVAFYNVVITRDPIWDRVRN